MANILAADALLESSASLCLDSHVSNITPIYEAGHQVKR